MGLDYKFTKDSIIGDIIDKGLVDILTQNGLNCLGCAACNNESLEEAAKGHGINLEKLLKALNERD